MRNRFDKELDLLNNELIEMGSLVEKAIRDASKALINKDMDLARIVYKSDSIINEKEKDIEGRCLRLLLQQHPVAGDLRLISSILKIITDMERIGDQAQDIAEITLNIVGQNYIKELTHIPQMADATMIMVKNSIDAFVNRDMELAKEVIKYDNIVDNLFDLIRDELIVLIREDIENGQQSMDLLMIAKYLERIGDHAQNIAEWVVFSISGEHLNNK